MRAWRSRRGETLDVGRLPGARGRTHRRRQATAWAGACKQPTAAVMSLALGFDGTYFSGDGTRGRDRAWATTSSPCPSCIHDDGLRRRVARPGLAHPERLRRAAGLLRRQVRDVPCRATTRPSRSPRSAPEGFNWAVLPPLAGTAGAVQAAEPADAVGRRRERARRGVGRSSSTSSCRPRTWPRSPQGDWLIPASTAGPGQSSPRARRARTAGRPSSPPVKASSAAPFQGAVNYPQWKDQYATPALQQYLADEITRRSSCSSSSPTAGPN